MFLQIHTLTSYPASLLNRDDAGLAKRIPFGNASRLRVSSQCQKRHWREELQALELPLEDGLRTRHLFSRSIYLHLQGQGVADDMALAVASWMKAVLFKTSGKGSDSEGDAAADEPGEKKGGKKGSAVYEPDEALQTQAAYFSHPEIRYLQQVALNIAQGLLSASDAEGAVRLALTGNAAKPKKLSAAAKSKLGENFNAMLKASGHGHAGAALSSALFGRFVTSDLLARVDAPVHVAHAFTVHAAASEMDYFTAVDDLNRSDETGAAHANQTELGAGLYYGYVVVDLPLLLSNLVGCERSAWREQPSELARKLLAQLITTIATKSPGAKLGSTAPHSRAELVLLEAGREQPRTLANAYLQALSLKGEGAPMLKACERMGQHLAQLDGMYGAGTHRQLSTMHPTAAFSGLTTLPLPQAIEAALDALWG